jgi:hypothetical protein
MTAVEEHLEKKVSAVAAGSYRHTVLLSAKRFKSSWVEFGKLLTKVRNEALFEQWGYDSFESYCFSELRIKKATADKLTKSYNFMEKHEPKALERDDIAETAPAWDVVSVLADAEERGALSGQEYKSIRDTIWNPEKTTSELKRELTEQFPSPEPKRDDKAELKRLTSWARRFAEDLHKAKKVPKSVAERADALADDLDELLQAQAEA